MVEAIREVVGVFDDPGALEKAVFALETHGFDRAAFSLLAAPPLLQHAAPSHERLGRVDDVLAWSEERHPSQHKLGRTAEPVPKILSAS